MSKHDNQDEVSNLQQRGFGSRLGFGQRPALLVIDFCRGFTDPEMPLGMEVDNQIKATNELLAPAHAKNIPTIFTTGGYKYDISEGGIFSLKVKGAWEFMQAGTPNVEIDPRLDRRDNDVVLVKNGASCFFGTNLSAQLTFNRVDTIIIAGCSTSGCVRATAVDACQSGFRPMVVREAVGDRSLPAHEQSLSDLESRYADVVGVQETVKYLAKVPGA